MPRIFQSKGEIMHGGSADGNKMNIHSYEGTLEITSGVYAGFRFFKRDLLIVGSYLAVADALSAIFAAASTLTTPPVTDKSPNATLS